MLGVWAEYRMGQNSKEVSVFLARLEKEGGTCRKEEGKVERGVRVLRLFDCGVRDKVKRRREGEINLGAKWWVCAW